MPRRRRLGRVGLLVLGALVGFGLTLLALYLFVDRSRNRVIEERVRVALGLPEEAFELEAVEDDETLRIALRNVAFLDRGRDTIVSAPIARARLLVSSLNDEDGPIVLDQAELIRPNLRLTQDASGEWNALRIVVVEAEGRRVGGAGADDEAPAKAIVVRNLRIRDGRARIATPYVAPASPPPGRFARAEQPERARIGGRVMTIRTLTGLDATLPLVRVGGDQGWRVEIASATARVTNPDTRIEALAGWIEDPGDENIRFDLRELRLPNSRFAGSGRMRFADETASYDVDLRASPLDFRDLQGMGLPLPDRGTAAFALGIETLPGSRTRWTVTDANVAILDSRASGRATVITGPNQAPVFSNTRLAFDRLNLSDLETLGYVEDLPVTGTVTGTVASLDAVEAGRGGSLRVDLAASVVPEETPRAEPARFTARGVVRFGTGADAFGFDGLRVETPGIDLATLRPLIENGERNAFLNGILSGGATLSGSARSFRIEGGDLAYRVGNAPESRLRGVSGRVTLQPALSYRLEARAEPLALATLTALFPSLPFRSAQLSGPIELEGSNEAVRFGVNLNGAAGGIEARGRLTLGEVLGFDVSGSLRAFEPGGVLASSSSVPVQGPVTGTFEARGTTREFRFGVDLTQPIGGTRGRAVLAGTVRNPGGPPQFDVSGRLENFQLGVLVGQPSLLPGPVTGPISVSGGGRQPYRFDVALRGELGLLDVEGWFAPGTVPSYAVSGAVAGLNLNALPGFAALPRTRLNGTLSINGRGTTPETFAGRVEFEATAGSTVGGQPLEAGIARLSGRDGLLAIDTLLFAIRGARFEGRGALGISRPAPQPLTFSLNVPNLQALRTLLPGADTLPDLAGSIAAAGTFTGTLQAPAVAARGEARGLRYGAWGAGQLLFDASGSRSAAGWTGNARLEGREVQLAFGGQRFETFTLETNVTPGLASFGLTARRDGETDLSAAGRLELAGTTVRGALLESLALRLGGVDWRLAERARIAFTEDGGLEVENLLLQRSGGAGPAWIAADGRLPPRGNADLRVHLEGVDLSELSRLLPNFPEARGRITLDAVIEGDVGDPRLNVDARVDSLAYGGVVADSLALTARYAAGRTAVNALVRLGDRDVLRAEASVPSRLSLGGIVPGFEILQDGSLTAAIAADSLPIALLAQTPQLADGEGVIRARVDVTGTPADPVVRGFAQVVDGAVRVVPLGVRWHTIQGTVTLEGETVRIDSLTARSGTGGRAFVNGTVLLDDPTRPQVNARVVLNQFKVIDNEDVASLESNADITIAGRLPGAEVTGGVEIQDGYIVIPELGAEAERDIVAADVGEIGADTITAAPAGAAALLGLLVPRELGVEIGESVWLQSPDARIKIVGNLSVTRGAGGALLVFGDLEAERGTFDVEILGITEREFDIVEGRVQFFGTPDFNPALDLTAAYEVRAVETESPLTIFVNLTGTLQNPRVSFSTDQRGTPLPTADIASLLLFGRRVDNLGGIPDALAPGALAQEAIGGFIAGQLEDQLIRTGLVDYVRVRSRSAASASGAGGASFGFDFLGPVTIEAGKEVIDNVFVSLLIVDLLSDQVRFGGALDWEVSRTFSVRAAYGPVRRDPLIRNSLNLDYQTTIDLRARWEYGRPPEQPPPEPDTTPEPGPAEPGTPTGEPPVPPPP